MSSIYPIHDWYKPVPHVTVNREFELVEHLLAETGLTRHDLGRCEYALLGSKKVYALELDRISEEKGIPPTVCTPFVSHPIVSAVAERLLDVATVRALIESTPENLANVASVATAIRNQSGLWATDVGGMGDVRIDLYDISSNFGYKKPSE